MSEVQKILDRSVLEYETGCEETEQALYALLMEKMPKKQICGDWNYSLKYEDAEKSGHNKAVDEVVSMINELFGRTE